MSEQEYRQLEEALATIANNTADAFTEGADGPKCATGERFITVAFYFGSIDQCYSKWEEIVNAYMITSKYEKQEGQAVDNHPTVTLYWRCKPEIREFDQLRRCYARLRFSTLPVVSEG